MQRPMHGGNNADKNEITDEMLLHAIADGLTWAMDPLYERYSRILYMLVYRMILDHQITENIIQDAFLSVWKHASTYSPKLGTVRSWIISIAHHRAIDHLRGVRRRSSLTETQLEDIERDESVAQPDAADEAIRSIEGQQVRVAILRLPPEQRLVIELAYFQGWTHSEIAEGCQIPLGTVKARMRLGLNHLKRVLGSMRFNDSM